MQRVVLLSIRVNLRYNPVKVGIRPERAFADELFAAGRALFVAGTERCYDAVVAEAVQAFFGGHCVLEYVEAYGAHELVLEDFGRDGNLRLVVDDLVRHSIQLVYVQLPGFRVAVDRGR